MKAVRIHAHGGPEVLLLEDIAEPKIKANEVLVRVRACALNHLDLFVRAGIPGMRFPRPAFWAAISRAKSSPWASCANAWNRDGACFCRLG